MTERFLGDDLATEALGAELAARTPPGGTWLLRGELGAGKTTWTRGFLAGLGGDPDAVASPTYAVLHRYSSPKGRVFHLDSYRLGEPARGPGPRRAGAAPGLLVVEWAGSDGPMADRWVAHLELEVEGEGRRARWTLPDTPPRHDEAMNLAPSSSQSLPSPRPRSPPGRPCGRGPRIPPPWKPCGRKWPASAGTSRATPQRPWRASAAGPAGPGAGSREGQGRTGHGPERGPRGALH
ncbi:MAG: tRNA (adenosine(37)-N6)-threonylcarbamoyltransferase complex ATPase subunit type 1 TsaE [Holophagaceae bacterium]|nr:tRNA (adenosine(37)-N6)-threonylcarbamoyltransferase complex ATPase subunit type 1 TsaE [Holophagaceae bacterium]